MAKPECRCEPPVQWSEWSEWLAAGPPFGRCPHARNRNRWRLPVLLMGILFATGRRTVTSWLRAAGVGVGFQDDYDFLSCVGRRVRTDRHAVGRAAAADVALARAAAVGDRRAPPKGGPPTKRYGPKGEGADPAKPVGIRLRRHHNPTPGPADQPYLYGDVWVTISLSGALACGSTAVRHPHWGPIALPLRAMPYVRQKTMASIPRRRDSRSVRRPGDDRTGLFKARDESLWHLASDGREAAPAFRIENLSRREGSLGIRPTAGSQHLDQPGGVQLESVDAFAGGTVGLGPAGCRLVRPQRLPWDDATRRPSHANRRQALRRQVLQQELSSITSRWTLPPQIIQLAESLLALAT